MAAHRRWADVRDEAGLEAARCQRCGGLISDVDLVSTECRAGYCTIVACACGEEIGSFGPVGCPSCTPWRSARLRKIRQAYARRRRR
jgi:hypothetical protein